jgi:hypothetical protein
LDSTFFFLQQPKILESASFGLSQLSLLDLSLILTVAIIADLGYSITLGKRGNWAKQNVMRQAVL